MPKLLRLIAPYRASVVIVLALALAQSLANLYLPRLMADIVDQGIVKEDNAAILSVGVWMLLIVTHSFGLEWQTAWPLLLVLVGLSMVVRALLQALPALLGGRS